MGRRVLIPVLDSRIEYYVNALRRQGAEPVVMHAAAGVDVGAADALLLPGGADIDPEEYGEHRVGANPPDDVLDVMQTAWLDGFVRAGKPVFGICRGHQLINVYFGGTLIQDLSDRPVHARNSAAEPDRYHNAAVTGEASWIFHVFHQKELHINSSHHEAVDRLGQGLLADLWSTAPEDTRPVLEAMHHISLPIWSVQFHPERCNAAFPEPKLVDGDAVFRFWMEQIE